MGRSALAPGSRSEITLIPLDATRRKVRDGGRPLQWRAVATYVDSDGNRHRYEKIRTSKAAAREAVRQEIDSFAKRQHVAKIKAQPTLGDAVAQFKAWNKRNPRIGDSTRDQYEEHVKRVIEGAPIESLKLSKVTSRVLREFLESVADERGTGSAKIVRTVLNAILKLAVVDGYIERNPMRDVDQVVATTARGSSHDPERAFTHAEREYLKAFCEMHTATVNADLVDLVWFLAGTGARLGEALSVHWEDVDLTAGTALVRGTKTKAAQRSVPLTPWLAEKLRARAAAKGRNGLVFQTPGRWTSAVQSEKPRDRRNVNRVLRQLFDEAGFPWAVSHSFRKAVVTIAVERGAPVNAVSAMVGHANVRVTNEYYLKNRISDPAGLLAALA